MVTDQTQNCQFRVSLEYFFSFLLLLNRVLKRPGVEGCFELTQVLGPLLFCSRLRLGKRRDVFRCWQFAEQKQALKSVQEVRRVDRPEVKLRRTTQAEDEEKSKDHSLDETASEQ